MPPSHPARPASCPAASPAARPRLGVALASLAAAASLLAPGVAAAAALRPFTQLASAVVRLSDLFEDAGPQAARALGPSPAPGESITVAAPQLAAIARQFGVAWQPASPGDRAVLQRPGVALPREAVLAVLRAALDGSGAGDGELDLADFESPTVAPEARARPLVEQLAFDPPSGRFTAALLVEGDAMPPLRLRVTGQLVAVEDVLVPTRRLAAGVALLASDLRPARVRVAGLPAGVLREAAEAAGLAPRRALAAGQPVARADLAPPMVVARGGRVMLTLASAGLAVASVGQALQAGAVGERIRVLNPVSRAVLLAEVTGPDAARVEPGSLPLSPGRDPGQAQPTAYGAQP